MCVRGARRLRNTLCRSHAALCLAVPQTPIPDDPARGISNRRGTLTFATAGPNTRTTQLFINLADNARLDGMGFTPVAEVEEAGMMVVDALYAGYGDGPPSGSGPDQGQLRREGNAYLRRSFPDLDYITRACVAPSPDAQSCGAEGGAQAGYPVLVSN